MTTKKEKSPTASVEASNVASSSVNPMSFADGFIDTLDHKKIGSLEEQIKNLKEKNSKKLYAVKLSSDLLNSLIDFVEFSAEWNQAEALGVIEIHKILTKIKKEGVKDNTIFMEGIPLEATHYFLSKSRGKGLKEASDFIDLYKPVSISLDEVKKDAAAIQDLEKELTAAQQGIPTI